jgi:hypothetical protein
LTGTNLAAAVHGGNRVCNRAMVEKFHLVRSWQRSLRPEDESGPEANKAPREPQRLSDLIRRFIRTCARPSIASRTIQRWPARSSRQADVDRKEAAEVNCQNVLCRNPDSRYISVINPFGLVMNITEEEAAQMYARACKAWYGPRANEIVRKKIRQLERQGDSDGVVAWTAVATELSRLQPPSIAGLGPQAPEQSKGRVRKVVRGN